jgi:lipopolysaccharide exporter
VSPPPFFFILPIPTAKFHSTTGQVMLNRKILSGTYWLLAGRIASNAVGIASTLVAARFLRPDDFGLVAIALAVFGLAGAVFELPVGLALVQIKDATKSDYDTAWTINVIRGLLISALMAVSSYPISIAYGDPRLTSIILALAIYPVLLGLRNSWFEAYVRNMDFRWEALTEFLAKLLSFSVVASVCITTKSYWALPLGLLASGAIALFLSYLLCARLPWFCLSEFRKFFRFSVWLGLGHLADSLREAVGTFLIGKFSGNTKLGAWSIGNQFTDRLELVLYAPLERTLFSAFSSIRGETNDLRTTYLYALHTGAVFMIPVCVGMGLISQEIVAIALGPNWELAKLVITFIAPAMAAHLLAGLASSLVISLGQTRAVFEAKAYTAAFQIPLMFFGIQIAGLNGALFSAFASTLLWFALSIALVTKHAGVSLQKQFSAFARSIGSALIMVAVVWMARYVLFEMSDSRFENILIRGASLSLLGALTYIASHFVLWNLSARPLGIERTIMTLAVNRSARDPNRSR